MSLPPSIAEVAELFGFAAAMRFVERFGGTTIHEVPSGRRAGGPVVQALTDVFGADAKRFMAHFAFTRLYVPRCVAQLRNERDRSIQTDYDGGSRVEDLARKYRISDRSVWKVLKRTIPDSDGHRRVDDSQLDMFNTTNG